MAYFEASKLDNNGILIIKVSGNDNMIHFSERLKLTRDFENFAAEHHTGMTPMAVICYLQLKGLLDVDKLHEYCKTLSLDS